MIRFVGVPDMSLEFGHERTGHQYARVFASRAVRVRCIVVEVEELESGSSEELAIAFSAKVPVEDGRLFSYMLPLRREP